MIVLSVILIVLFLLNFILYYFNLKKNNSSINLNELKAFKLLWSCFLYPIPLINSSLLGFLFTENLSYFGDNYLWFIVLGMIFIIFGFKLRSLASKIRESDINKGIKLSTKGIYKVLRHPTYLAGFLLFLGITFCLDSLVSVLFIPVLILIIELRSSIEEKYVLIREFKTKYVSYMEKTPFRLFPNPYNYILGLIAIIVIYIGIVEFFF